MKLPATLCDRFRVEDGSKFRLADFGPGDTNGVSSKEQAADLLTESIAELADLQYRFWADGRRSMLLIFQALDAAGKDSVIKHVMSGVNPQGCEVHAFRAPSDEELRHDYLWRAVQRLPEKGRIGIFNRSYYEEVLVVRVHPELLEKQKLPPEVDHKNIWQQRFQDMRIFETYLARHGIIVLKFFLHVSKEEQRKRFMERIEKPDKNWKFSMGDVEERQHWDEYMAAYEEMIQHTSAPNAPWFCVPADHKWFTRLIVATAIIDSLRRLKPEFPKMTPEQRKDLKAARQALMVEDSDRQGR
jgi:PPK2 family polyphosphate:nucleotide phosphotransferase